MMEQGLMKEAEDFYRRYGGSPQTCPTAAQAIGYKELWPAIEGQIPLEVAVDHLKQQTRRYAKRQLTWFRRDPRTHWLEADDDTELSLVERALAIWKQYLAQFESM